MLRERVSTFRGRERSKRGYAVDPLLESGESRPVQQKYSKNSTDSEQVTIYNSTEERIHQLTAYLSLAREAWLRPHSMPRCPPMPATDTPGLGG